MKRLSAWGAATAPRVPNFSWADPGRRRVAFLGLLLSLSPVVVRGAACVATAEAARGPLAEALYQLVDEAQVANLELLGGTEEVQHRIAVLEAARARYLPQVEFQARYTVAAGGRTVEIPIKDYLSPVYTTLQQLRPTSSYPPLTNEEIPFQRSHEQDTAITVKQTLFDASLGASRNAAARGLENSRAALAALRDRVTRDMELAYLSFLQADAEARVLDRAVDLAGENLRVSRALFDRGKQTRDFVYRAEADLMEVTQEHFGASSALETQCAYVNLLRNYPLASDVRTSDADQAVAAELSEATVGSDARGDLTELTEEALSSRKDLFALDAAYDEARANVALALANYKPTLSLVLEAGTQGISYGLSAADRYVLADIVLRFNLFDGGGTRASVADALSLAAKLASARADAQNRIRFEVQQTLQNLAISRRSAKTAAKRLEAAREAFRISARKRDLGSISQAEFVDARRTLTEAELNVNRTQFAVLSSHAELDYTIGRVARALQGQ